LRKRKSVFRKFKQAWFKADPRKKCCVKHVHD
jgi:hypothetical protein